MRKGIRLFFALLYLSWPETRVNYGKESKPWLFIPRALESTLHADWSPMECKIQLSPYQVSKNLSTRIDWSFGNKTLCDIWKISNNSSGSWQQNRFYSKRITERRAWTPHLPFMLSKKSLRKNRGKQVKWKVFWFGKRSKLGEWREWEERDIYWWSGACRYGRSY